MRIIYLLGGCVLALSGCSDGVYSATADGNGNVVVVNRFTGDARVIHGATVANVKPQPPSVESAKHAPGGGPHNLALDNLSIVGQPFSIRGVAKFRGGNLLVRLSFFPQNRSMTETEWVAWRAHLHTIQEGSAGIILHFIDDDMFEVASQRVTMSSLTQQLGLDDKLASAEEQISLPMSAADYEAITGWNLTWGGFWPPYSAPEDNKAGASRK